MRTNVFPFIHQGGGTEVNFQRSAVTKRFRGRDLLLSRNAQSMFIVYDTAGLPAPRC